MILLGLDIKMFYGGPKEAVMHGIYRQNFGFTDIVVGRKHADAPFHDGTAIWGDFDAQEIFGKLGGDLKIDAALARLSAGLSAGEHGAGTLVVASSLETTGTSIVIASPGAAARLIASGAGAELVRVSRVGGIFLPPKQAASDRAPSATIDRRVIRIIISSFRVYSREASPAPARPSRHHCSAGR